MLNVVEIGGRVLRTYAAAFSGLPRDIWLLAWVMLINRAGSMVIPFLALYVNKELGYSQAAAALMIVFYGLGSSLGNVVGGRLTAWLGPEWVQCLSLLLNGVGFVALGQVDSYAAFAAVLIVTSTFAETFRPANATAITMRLSPRCTSGRLP